MTKTNHNSKFNPFKSVAESLTRLGTINIENVWERNWVSPVYSPRRANGMKFARINNTLLALQYFGNPDKLNSVFATPKACMDAGINIRGSKTISILNFFPVRREAREEVANKLGKGNEHGETKRLGLKYTWDAENEQWTYTQWRFTSTRMLRVADFGEEAEAKFPKVEKNDFAPIDNPKDFDSEIENVAEAVGVKIKRDELTARACFVPEFKEIQVPRFTQFVKQFGGNEEKAKAHYFETIFHELAHAIRDHFIGANNWNYAREEIIAEGTAFYLLCESGMYSEHLAESVAQYTRSWFKTGTLQLNAEQLEKFLEVQNDIESVINFFNARKTK